MKNEANKNIAMVAYTYYKSDPRVRKEAESLTENGFNIDFLSLKKEGENSFGVINGVNIYRLNCKHYKGKSNVKYFISYIIFFLKVFFKLSFLYFRKRYQLIHINNMPDFLVFCALIPKIFGAKIILDIHDVMSNVFFNRGEIKRNFIIEKILISQEYISSKFSDRVITVDNYCKEIISMHGTRKNNILVVSNFPDENIFKSLKRNHLKDDTFNLFFHGTISKIYGLDVVIKGIGKVYKKIPGLKFTIIGEGNYEDEISELIRNLKLERVIKFKNKKIPQEKIPEEIRNADLGIVSYSCLNTIFSNKFLEYTAMGIPTIIAYNEQVYNYFKSYNLEFYERNNPNSFASKLLHLYKNKKRYDKLRETALELGRKFRWSKEKVKYVNLVNSLVSR